MIILNCNQFLLSPYSIKEIFVVQCIYELAKLQAGKSLDLRRILDKYDIETIKHALNNITLDNENNLVVPENTASSLIIRELEFGGPNQRALHILARAKQNMNLKEGDNVL